MTVQLSQWRHEDKVVLVGDAAHAVFPFYGQGMNAALQDCRNLVACLEKNDNLENAFIEYEKMQKPSTKALSELCEAHFYYLQGECASALTQAQNKVTSVLSKIKPKAWLSEYHLVAQTDMPYNEIVNVLKKQTLVRKMAGIVIVDYLVAGAIMVTRKFSPFKKAVRSN